LVPQTIATIRKINNQEGRYFFKILFDSGATPEAMIKQSKFPLGIVIHTMPTLVQVQTTI
jgi:predicted phage gp36 major capsid-like protein